jgi:invasion protein IalB
VGQAEFSRCFPEGCFSEVVLDSLLTERLKKGKNSFFIVFPEETRGVGFPISLKGLTAGLQNLP